MVHHIEGRIPSFAETTSLPIAGWPRGPVNELRQSHALAVDFPLEGAEYFGPDGSETHVCARR